MDLMTLAISETSKGKYDVVVVDIDNLKYYAIDGLKTEQIVSSTNEVFWDIGAVTRLEASRITNDRKLTIMGSYELARPFNRAEFKKMLGRLASKKSDIFANKKKLFDVVRVNRVNKIWTDESVIEIDGKAVGKTTNKPKHRLEAHVYAEKRDGTFVDEHGIEDPNGYYLIITLLNKDFRWVQYWDWVETALGEQEEEKKEKRKKYLAMLNSPRLEKYFVIYRCFFKDGSEVSWICGIHAV